MANSPLIAATSQRDYHEVQRLIEENAPFTVLNSPRNRNGDRLIHMAVFNEDLELLNLFIRTDPAFLEDFDDSGRTPIHLAALLGILSVTESLLEAGANSNIKTKDGGQTPLHFVSWSQRGDDDEGSPEEPAGILVAKSLLKHGANLQAQDETGDTPLSLAVYQCYVRLAGFYIKSMADDRTFDINGFFGTHTLLYKAVHSHHPFRRKERIVLFLQQMGANIETQHPETGLRPLHQAVDEIDGLQLLIARGANINATAFDGSTPLHIALGEGCSFEIIELLITHGANVNATTFDESTPLLLALGVNATTNDGSTPLHQALDAWPPADDGDEKEYMMQVLKTLLDAGADIDTKDQLGDTPLLKSCFDNPKMARLLLDRGADPRVENMYSITPLSRVKRSNSRELITLISDALPSPAKLAIEPVYTTCGLVTETLAKQKEDGKEGKGDRKQQQRVREERKRELELKRLAREERQKEREKEREKGQEKRQEEQEKEQEKLSGDTQSTKKTQDRSKMSERQGRKLPIKIPVDLAEEWFKKVERISSALGHDGEMERVKIAILDSGIYPDHPQMDCVSDFKDFVDETNDSGRLDEHEVKHGSAGVSFVLRVAPESELYIARVFRHREADTESPSRIAKAILHAIDTWKVDIITLACGFEIEYAEMVYAIQKAYSQNVFIFAAASNSANFQHIAFPADMHPEVMCMFACNGQNTITHGFNPGPMRRGDNFAILGQGLSASPNDEHAPREGTSYSVFIAAGIAALLLDFYRQPDIEPQLNHLVKLKRMAGMRAVFLDMAEHGAAGDYNCVVPWDLLDEHTTLRKEQRQYIVHKIRIALGRRR
ncbi:Ankyrin-3 [Dactylellina cionopaga]|nr:Ankyrin-3 [Dactylellina cionopaga]